MLALDCVCSPVEGAPQQQAMVVPASNGAMLHANAHGIYLQGYDAASEGPLELVDGTAQTMAPMGAPVLQEGHPARGLVYVPFPGELVPGHVYIVQAELAGLQITTFTASTGDDTTPPAIPESLAIAVAVASFHADVTSSCGPELTSVTGTLSGLDPDTVLVARFTAASGGAVVERVLLPHADVLTTLGSDPCSVSAPLARGATYTVEVLARDLAGNESAARTTSLTVRDCGEIADYRDVPTAAACVYRGEPPVGDPSLPDPMPTDDSGCSTAGASSNALWAVLGALGLVALVRRRR